MPSGIYTITCLSNNKMYIGYTTNIDRRWYEHSSLLKRGIHPNIYLQTAWNKHGADSFHFELLEEWYSDFLPSMEHFWVNSLRTNESRYGYNLKVTHPEGRTVQSEEVKRKISQKNKGRKRTDKTWVGRKHSEESKRKMREARLGKTFGYKHSEETKRKIAESNKTPQLGKKHSEDHKQKISEGLRKTWSKRKEVK